MTIPRTAYVPVQPEAIDLDMVRPSVEDIAVLLRTRTINDGDVEQDTFTEDTRPTASEVEIAIDGAVDEVLSQIPDTVFPKFYPQIKRVIRLATAIEIEASFFREQTAQGPIGVFQRQFDQAMSRLPGLLRSGIVQ